MSYLCYDCTSDFVAETMAEGHGLRGITYVEPAQSSPAECDRCGRSLPESFEQEQAAEHLLIRTVAVMRDRTSRAMRILEGNA